MSGLRIMMALMNNWDLKSANNSVYAVEGESPRYVVSDLGATSLDIVDFLMAIEERLGIKIEDSEAEAMRTFTDAVEIVESKRRFPLQ